MSDPDPSAVISARLLEAREYLGFSVDQVARALSYSPLLIEGMEDGTITPTDGALFRLGRLYRRPVAWFRGEWKFEPSPELLHKAESLGEGDREAILDFAGFLRCAKESENPFPVPTGKRGEVNDV